MCATIVQNRSIFVHRLPLYNSVLLSTQNCTIVNSVSRRELYLAENFKN